MACYPNNYKLWYPYVYTILHSHVYAIKGIVTSFPWNNNYLVFDCIHSYINSILSALKCEQIREKQALSNHSPVERVSVNTLFHWDDWYDWLRRFFNLIRIFSGSSPKRFAKSLSRTSIAHRSFTRFACFWRTSLKHFQNWICFFIFFAMRNCCYRILLNKRREWEIRKLHSYRVYWCY